jgi:hypothetical protein
MEQREGQRFSVSSTKTNVRGHGTRMARAFSSSREGKHSRNSWRRCRWGRPFLLKWGGNDSRNFRSRHAPCEPESSNSPLLNKANATSSYSRVDTPPVLIG